MKLRTTKGIIFILLVLLSMTFAYSVEYSENITFYAEDSNTIYNVNRTIDVGYAKINVTHLIMNNQSFDYSGYTVGSGMNISTDLFNYFSLDTGITDTLNIDSKVSSVGVTGGWTYTQNALFSGGYEINTQSGTNYLSYNTTNSLVDGNVTYSMWYKANYTGTTSTLMNLYYNGPGSKNEIRIYLVDEILYLKSGYNTNPACNNDINIVWDFSLRGGSSLNNWTSIIYKQNETNGYVYVNGILGNTTDNVSCTTLNTASIKPVFGGLATVTGNNYKGQIDEIRRYNYSLTDTQIAALGNLSLSGNITRQIYNISVNIKRSDTLELFAANVSLNSTNSYSLMHEYATGGQKNIILTDAVYTYNVSSTDITDISGTINITYLNESIDLFITPTSQIDNCNKFSGMVINFTMYHEINNTLAVGDAAGYFQLTPAGFESPIEVNITWNNVSNFGLCVRDLQSNYTLTGQMRYNSTGYDYNELYYWDTRVLQNETTAVSLYFTSGSDRVTFTVTDPDDKPLEGILIQILEYDLTTNTATISEIIRTDSKGQATGNIVLDTKRYKFILTYKDVVVLETVDSIIRTTDQTFRVNLATDYLQNWDKVRQASCSVTFDSDVPQFEYVYTDSSGEVTYSCLNVIKRTGLGDIDVSQSCLSTSTGQININLSGQELNNEFIGTGQIYINGEPQQCGMASYSYSGAPDKYGLLGILLSVFIIITLVGMTIRSPVMAVVLSMVGIVLVNMLGLFHLNTPVLIGFVFASLVALFKMSRAQR